MAKILIRLDTNQLHEEPVWFNHAFRDFVKLLLLLLLTTAEVNPAGAASSCPPYFVTLPEKDSLCIYFNPKLTRSFTGAEYYCQTELGSELFKFSAKEAQYVSEYVSQIVKKETFPIWIDTRVDAGPKTTTEGYEFYSSEGGLSTDESTTDTYSSSLAPVRIKVKAPDNPNQNTAATLDAQTASISTAAPSVSMNNESAEGSFDLPEERYFSVYEEICTATTIPTLIPELTNCSEEHQFVCSTRLARVDKGSGPPIVYIGIIGALAVALAGVTFLWLKGRRGGKDAQNEMGIEYVDYNPEQPGTYDVPQVDMDRRNTLGTSVDDAKREDTKDKKGRRASRVETAASSSLNEFYSLPSDSNY